MNSPKASTAFQVLGSHIEQIVLDEDFKYIRKVSVESDDSGGLRLTVQGFTSNHVSLSELVTVQKHIH